MSKKQSDAGVVRERLAQIERDIYNGIRHEAILEELNALGHSMSLATFRTHLARARIKARQLGQAHQTQVQPAVQTNLGPAKNIQSSPQNEGNKKVEIERGNRPPLIIAARPERFKSSLDKDDEDDPAI